jgi:methylglutaconyl-CoA hydratase
MSAPLVLRADEGPVAVLTLNRPDRHNVLSRALIAELSDLLNTIAVEHQVRAVVLTASGKVFCAGMDLKEATAAGKTIEGEKLAVSDVQSISDLIGQVHRLPQPVIAALNGDAFAGGAGLAMACDLVIAADHIRIGYPEVRRGLVPSVVMHDLIRIVGERQARYLLLSGESVSAAEAESWGLVNRIVPADTCRVTAVALARSIAACGPQALSTTKRLILEASGRPFDLRGAAAISAAVRVSDEAVEGMRAFLEKRQPRWAAKGV